MARRKSSHIEEKVNVQQPQETQQAHPSITALGFMFFHCFLYHNDKDTEERILAWSNAAQNADKCPDKYLNTSGSATSALLDLLELAKEKNKTIMQ